MMNVSSESHSIDYQTLPKIIWIYWHQGEKNTPFLVSSCMASWRKRNPAWTIRVIDGASLRQTVDMEGLDCREDIPLQALSDVIRVKLLTRHGGVWADATLFCAQPLDTWLPRYYVDRFFAFASRRRDRVMTTWFLAADKDSEILQLWTREMLNFWHSHRFRKKSDWGRQVIRKLMSLRKRDIVSNDIWFSSLLTKKLRLFPYPINMYLFERTLELNPHLKTAWFNRDFLYDAPAEHLQNVLGMNAPVTEASRRFIADDNTPVHKLNWRQDLGLAVKGSNLDLLISRLNSDSEECPPCRAP
jgi:hypothetical protein